MRFQTMYTDLFANGQSVATQPERLQEVIARYPYFSMAHFFLLDKVEEGSDVYPTIASRTALHFNNPFLLNEHVHPPKPSKVSNESILPPTEEVSIENDAVNDPGTEQDSAAEIVDNQQITEAADEDKVPSMAADQHDAISNREIESKEASTAELTDREPEIISPSNNSPIAEPPETSTKTKEDAPIFEPLFASDYFASQGIKLSDEQQPSDRMGQQLKSFTAWLKTMKKVHEAKVPVAEAPVDITVQTLAEKSNTGEEVVTEAMAEVYLQQGKVNKAREIYQKLSLLNPSKNAYFAAKLEQIK